MPYCYAGDRERVGEGGKGTIRVGEGWQRGGWWVDQTSHFDPQSVYNLPRLMDHDDQDYLVQSSNVTLKLDGWKNSSDPRGWGKIYMYKINSWCLVPVSDHCLLVPSRGAQ